MVETRPAVTPTNGTDPMSGERATQTSAESKQKNTQTLDVEADYHTIVAQASLATQAEAFDK